MELTTKDWKEFRIGDLFNYERGKESAPNQNPEGECKLISETQDNNGFVRFVEPTRVIEGHCITVSVNFASTVFYQDENFCASVNIIVLRSKVEMTEKQLLFIASILCKKHKTYSYTDKVSKDLLMNEFILLPSKNDEPDWDFMEEFIKEIEEKYILNVDKYNQENIDKALSVTGLTTADLNGNLEVKPADRYEEFRVGDLFDVNTIRGVNNESLNNDYSKGKYRYITRTSLNNGISSITGKIGGLEIQKSNTFSLGLLGMNFFFQTEPWYAGQFVRNISPKFEINRPLSLYFGTLFNKRSKSYQSVLIRDFDKIFKNEKIKLPAIDEDTPDFDYMEKAIYIYILKRSLSLGKWITKKKSEL